MRNLTNWLGPGKKNHGLSHGLNIKIRHKIVAELITRQ